MMSRMAWLTERDQILWPIVVRVRIHVVNVQPLSHMIAARRFPVGVATDHALVLVALQHQFPHLPIQVRVWPVAPKVGVGRPTHALSVRRVRAGRGAEFGPALDPSGSDLHTEDGPTTGTFPLLEATGSARSLALVAAVSAIAIAFWFPANLARLGVLGRMVSVIAGVRAIGIYAVLLQRLAHFVERFESRLAAVGACQMKEGRWRVSLSGLL